MLLTLISIKILLLLISLFFSVHLSLSHIIKMITALFFFRHNVFCILVKVISVKITLFFVLSSLWAIVPKNSIIIYHPFYSTHMTYYVQWNMCTVDWLVQFLLKYIKRVCVISPFFTEYLFIKLKKQFTLLACLCFCVQKYFDLCAFAIKKSIVCFDSLAQIIMATNHQAAVWLRPG